MQVSSSDDDDDDDPLRPVYFLSDAIFTITEIDWLVYQDIYWILISNTIISYHFMHKNWYKVDTFVSLLHTRIDRQKHNLVWKKISQIIQTDIFLSILPQYWKREKEKKGLNAPWNESNI